MISDKNLSEMMGIYASKGEVTTKELNNLGFSSAEITKLVHTDKILLRKERGLYKVDKNELLNKAMTAYRNDNIMDAYMLILRCYLEDRSNLLYAYNLFLLSVLVDKPKITIECINILLDNESEFYNKNDINYYLYLLSLVIDLPEDLLLTAKTMRFADIYVEDNAKNEFRGNVINNRLSEIVLPKVSNNIEDRVEHKLINNIILRQKTEKSYESGLIINRKYTEFLEYIDEKLSYRKLNILEENFTGLVNTYFEIINTKKIPVITSTEYSNLWDAISNNNFRTALRLQKEFCEKNNMNLDTNIIYILLLDINEKIDEILDLNKKEDERKEEKPAKKEEIDLNTVSLEGKSIEEITDFINSYIKTSEYNYIVNYMLKVSVYENDKTFSKPLMLTSMINNNKFTFNLGDYILSFYENLAECKYDIAGVYLDILDKAVEKKHAKLVIKDLRDLLNNAIKSDDKLSRKNYDFVTSSEVSEESYSFEDLNTSYSLDEFKERGIILTNYDKEKINDLNNVINHLPYVEAFCITYNANNKIVLRYKNINKILNQSDTTKLINKASINYNSGNYSEALNDYKELLKNTILPTSDLYSRIGNLCVMLNKRDEAIDYLITANSLSMVKELDVKYNEAIDYLVKTSKPKMLTEVDINKIVELINENKTLEEIKELLNLRDDEYLKYALLIAREYYYRGDYKTGDKYYNIVKKRSKSKTTEILDLEEDIRINKLFYKNREGGVRLSLK